MRDGRPSIQFTFLGVVILLVCAWLGVWGRTDFWYYCALAWFVGGLMMAGSSR